MEIPLTIEQFEEAIRHRRGRRCGDGQSLVDRLEDKAAVEAPGEGAEVAQQMLGADDTMRGQEAVLDVRQQGVRPAVGLMARVQRPSVRGGLDRDDKWRVPAPAASGALASTLAADIGVVDLDARAS